MRQALLVAPFGLGPVLGLLRDHAQLVPRHGFPLRLAHVAGRSPVLPGNGGGLRSDRSASAPACPVGRDRHRASTFIAVLSLQPAIAASYSFRAASNCPMSASTSARSVWATPVCRFTSWSCSNCASTASSCRYISAAAPCRPCALRQRPNLRNRHRPFVTRRIAQAASKSRNTRSASAARPICKSRSPCCDCIKNSACVTVDDGPPTIDC